MRNEEILFISDSAESGKNKINYIKYQNPNCSKLMTKSKNF